MQNWNIHQHMAAAEYLYARLKVPVGTPADRVTLQPGVRAARAEGWIRRLAKHQAAIERYLVAGLGPDGRRKK